jgi:tRNA(Arg) A34 adenosine deaminase TadA
MRVAMEEAEIAVARGDDPYGGVIADRQGNILVRDGNREFTEQNPTAHCEIVLIREACKKLKSNDLSDYVLFCNAECCSMCASGAVLAGIREFYIGCTAARTPAYRPHIRLKEVAAASYDDYVLVEGLFDDECWDIVRRGRAARAADRARHSARGSL